MCSTIDSCVKDFKNYWPILLDKIKQNSTYVDIQQSVTWLERLLTENVPHGKLVRALTFLEIYRDLVVERTEEEDELSYIIAWCIEIMQTAYLVADDMMDNSETRRGNPCWYRLPDVGTMAINDSLLLENLVYQLINNAVEDKKLALELTQMFLNTSYKTILGQALDTRISFLKDYDKFTLETYSAIVKYKTSFYTFYQPAALALILARKTEPQHLKPVEDVCLKLGHLFQVQDDYIDCYADPNLSGKIGTDIIDAKCSWLAATALTLANKEQKATFAEYYGVKDNKAETIIKGLYSDLKIRETFQTFKDSSYSNIVKAIDTLASDIPKEPFINLLNLTYKREK